MQRLRYAWAWLRRRRCMAGCDRWDHHPGGHVLYMPAKAFDQLMRELEEDR